MDDRQPQRLDELQQVLDITRMMAGSDDLDELLAVIIDRSCELLDAERASLFLYEAETNELVSRIATGADEIRFPADKGIAGATLQDRQTIHVPDAYADDRFNSAVDKESGFRTRNILSVPLMDHEGERVGVLQVLNRRGGGFTDGDIWLAETLAAQAGVSLQRARLIGHYVQKREMERALEIAREIQRGLLPSKDPEVPGFDVAGFNRSADETGGDIYDFGPTGDGRLLITVADASGHGVGPAIIVAETRAMIRAASLNSHELSVALTTANTLLDADLESHFVTCFLGLLDPAASQLTYSSAGHGPMVFYKLQDDQFTEVAATSLPLGILPDSEYDKVLTFDFAPGDLAVITTDGFFEAADPGGEQFGMERMNEVLRQHREASAAEIIATLYEVVTAFVGDQPQADDLTAVVLKKN